ncbi:MAG TPA: hypothetical protein PKM50_05370 [Methanoregula sp.]|nr:hypothetical protein [Methanoregula sp.]
MYRHQERVAILLLIAVALVVIVAHVALVQIGKAPFANEYTVLATDGTLVSLSGTIEQATVIKNGGHVLLSVDNVTIFIPATIAGDRSFVKGTKVSLYGTVQTYLGKKEIVVQSLEDIREIL